MKQLDTIILSNTINIEYYNFLAACIKSIKEDIDANIIVVETNTKLQGKDIMLPIDHMVFPNEKFNYNRFLNYGLKKCSCDKILISNNDVVYENNCINEMINALHTYDSVSPLDTNNPRHKNITTILEGNQVGVHVTGYSICMNKKVIDTINNFDEDFSFWYQDNDYCSLLRKHNLKHALIPQAQCFHYGEQSHKLIPHDEIYEKTNGSIEILNKKWGDNPL